MGIQLAALIQIIITITVIAIAIRLVIAVFRMAKSLEGIDNTLHQIHKKLEDKSKSN